MNDLFTSKVNFRKGTNQTSTVIQKSTDREFIIDNREADSQIYLQNYDSSNVMRRIIINSTMSMSGVNDLYVQRLFLNNVLFDPITVTNLITKTTQMEYVAETAGISPHTRFTVGLNQGIYMIPKIQAGKNYWNGSAQTGDNVIISEGGPLTLTSSATTITGVRVSSTQTELFNAKVDSNGLKFNDDTVQTTAITQSQVNSLINSAIQSAISQIIPVGTIFSYGGAYLNNLLQIISPPTGYLWCFGALIQQSSYTALFNAIGHSYAYGRVIPTGNFYLPDLSGATLKGCRFYDRFTIQTSGSTVGEIQQCNVGTHSHIYKDRGNGERNVAITGTSKGANTNEGNYFTSGEAYNPTTQAILDSDTRPNSICINYIIKF